MSEGKPAAARILLVDDDPDLLRLLDVWLRNAGYEVDTAESAASALTRIGLHRPDLIITDLFMAGMDGMQLVSAIHRDNPLVPVIMLSGQAQIADAVKATHLGAAAFLTKPVDKHVLCTEVENCLRIRRGSVPNRDQFGKALVFQSAVMAELMEQALLVAQSDITVFISGDTGTGKELLAKAIHAASPRAGRPFIGVNCGAIPEQLLESELFGHEKGAFTGAATRHTGLFQAADGGTLFLDEIGDMPLALQVKLLRVLQDFEVRPVGSVTAVSINVRIISATHQDLASLVRKNEFREDLYYRLHVVPLPMPNLGERREDIPLLVEHCLGQIAVKTGKPRKRFAPEALSYLIGVSWPGNVRQLANAVELCATLTTGDIIALPMAQRAMREEPARMATLKEAKDEFERKYLVSVLRLASGNVANAARIAGRNRTEFYKLLTLHGIDPVDFRDPAPPRSAPGA